MKWSGFSVLLVALLLTVTPAGARARHAVRPKAQTTKAQARKLFAQANRLIRARRYAAAIQGLKKAYSLWPHSAILYNTALAHAFLGQHVEAAKAARRYLKKHPLGPGKRLPKVLRRALARTGLLVIQLPDPQATIYVDGRLAGRGKAEVVVLPGRHAIDVRVKDRVVAHTTVIVPAGKEKMWELAAIPRPRPRLRPQRRAATSALRPEVTGPRRKGLHWAYLTTAASITAASLAGAIAFSVLTKAAYDDNVAQPSPSSKDRGERLQTTANVFWGVTAAMAVTATVLSIFTRFRATERSQPRAQPRTQITITPMGAGVGLSGTWP